LLLIINNQSLKLYSGKPIMFYYTIFEYNFWHILNISRCLQARDRSLTIKSIQPGSLFVFSIKTYLYVLPEKW
jgi:hypothetical protein